MASNLNSIPTPPFSPLDYKLPDATAENPLRNTINLLDSLVAFYQHERMWVYRTRAILEGAFPSPPVIDAANSSPYTEYLGDDITPQKSRWSRRKRGFKLRIDGIRSKRNLSTQPIGQTLQFEQLPPREQILEMFEKMMEARMESCQRVSRLVRDANRASLHFR